MTSDFPDLADEEFLLDVSDDGFLLRHVHPKACDGDKIESWAFGPQSNDKGKMSVTQEALVDVAESVEQYTRTRESVGMWGFTTAEVESVGSRAIDDTKTTPPPPAGPAYVDYRDLKAGRRQPQKRARKSRDCAIARGRRYSPTANQDRGATTVIEGPPAPR